MKYLKSGLVLVFSLAGCQTTTTGPTPAPGPVAAGYADGTKTILTEGLIFTSAGKTAHLTAGGANYLQDYNISVQLLVPSAEIIATVDGKDITLSGGSTYTGSNTTHDVIIKYLDETADGQVMLISNEIFDKTTGELFLTTVATGMATNPAQVTALTGTATYNGTAELNVAHDQGSSFGLGQGVGTATLDVDFGSRIISGSMSFTDQNGIGPPYGISPTIILIDPTTISGNGFSTTLTITPSDLVMSGVSSSALDGTFFGVNAADVGGTFSAQGISADGTSAVFITGGFIAE